MEQARVRLHLDVQNLALQRLALDSEKIQGAWGGLPRDVQKAHKELQRLTQQHVRVGHLNRRERAAVRLHQEHIRRHHEGVRREVTSLNQRIQSHESAAEYHRLKKGGGLAGAIKSDPAVADLHAMMQRRTALESQAGTIGDSRAMFGQHGLSGHLNLGQAASHYGRRALLGTNPNTGAPNTLGQWAAGGARQGFGRARQRTRQIAGILGAFSGMTLINRSLNTYEQHAEAVQELGARMGGQFDFVANKVGEVRKAYKYTLQELRPAAAEFARLTGNINGTEGAARFARATGMSPAVVAGHQAKARMYGPLNSDLFERAMSSSLMSNRPEAFLSGYSNIQQTLGSGFYSVPDDEALKYIGMITGSMGQAYSNERGMQLATRVIQGGRASGSGMVGAIKLGAMRRLGKLDLGDGIIADTRTHRGMRLAMESGSHKTIEALRQEAILLGGRGEIGEEIFQTLMGGQLSTLEASQIFRSGEFPTRAGLKKGANLDPRLKGVRGTDAYKLAGVRTDLEADVYEPLGKALQPVVMDFKNAGHELVGGLLDAAQKAGDVGDALELAIGGMDRAVAQLHSGANSNLTPFIVQATLLAASNSLLSAGIKEAILAGFGIFGSKTGEEHKH